MIEYRKVPFMYNPMRPGDGLSGIGVVDPGRVVSLAGLGDPDPGMAYPRGWPGFFQWLADEQPDVHQLARVALPNLAARQAHGNPASVVLLRKVPGLKGVRGLGAFGSGLGRLGQDVTAVDTGTAPPGADLGYGDVPPPDVTPVDITPDPVYVANTAQQTSPGLLQSITSTITAIGSAVLPLVQQQKLLDVNVARAKAGQPPLTLAQYESQTSGLNVGVNPATQKFLLAAIVIGGGLLILPRLLRRA